MPGNSRRNPFWLGWFAILLLALVLSACRNGEDPPDDEGQGTPPAAAATQTAASGTAGPSRTTEAAAGNGTTPGGERPAATRTPTPSPSATPVPRVRVIYNSIHVRNGPGLDQRSFAYLFKDDVVTALEVSDDGFWYLVELKDGTTGWIAASVVEPVVDSPFFAGSATADTDGVRFRVRPSSINLRLGPGTTYPIMRRLLAGDVVTATGRTASGDWYYVRAEGGYQGWLASGVVTPVNETAVEAIRVIQIDPTPSPTSAPSPTP